MKKAQGLPINTIIIAALALVVLVILIGIVGFRTQKFGKGVSETTEGMACASANGQVTSYAQCDVPIIGTFNDVQPGQVCCEKRAA
jgi:hypothetical protein